jgi:hypothetical protein
VLTAFIVGGVFSASPGRTGNGARRLLLSER